MLIKKLRRLLEFYAPALVGVITLAACLSLRNQITHTFVNDKLSLSQLYSGVFGYTLRLLDLSEDCAIFR